MAVLRRPFARARRLAREVLWECGVDEPSKIDPFAIVGRHGIQVRYARIDGASARIFRHGDRAIIRVSDQIVQIGRLRFTIAHEVAHFLLGHQIPSEGDLDAGAAPFSVHQEREADVFASEFLMPKEWVAPMCAAAPSLSAVHAIAKRFVRRSSRLPFAMSSLPAFRAPSSTASRAAWCGRSAVRPSRDGFRHGASENRLGGGRIRLLRSKRPRCHAARSSVARVARKLYSVDDWRFARGARRASA